MPNWRASQSPGAWWSNALPVSGDGVENLSIVSTASNSTNSITLYNAYGCWVKGVRSIDPRNHHVEFWQSAHNTIRDSYFYLTQSNIEESYGIEWYIGADNLIENNIFQNIANPILIAQSPGDVVAYNFSTYDHFGDHTWMMQSNYTHAPGTNYGLFEGNVGTGMQLEDYHGMAHFMTAFRNRYTGYEPSPAPANQLQTVPIMIQAFARYANVIGNVLGTAGYHTTYQTNVGSPSANCNRSIYTIGYGDNCDTGNSGHPVKDDPAGLASHMRWGNYDTVNNTTRFVNGEVPSAISAYANPVPASQLLPASFYLSAKPNWWPSAKAWPPIGPDVVGGNIPGVAGHTYTIPSQDCYLNVLLGPADGSGGALNFNASTCYANAGSPPPGAPTNLQAIVN